MNPIPYNGDGGYLSKNDIIKGMAAEIDMLRKELHISNEMKFTYMDDCTKMLAENARLKAEVEQLQKLVGMQKSIDESIDAWIESKRNAAKEGKQP